jgi:hypothetical protein
MPERELAQAHGTAADYADKSAGRKRNPSRSARSRFIYAPAGEELRAPACLPTLAVLLVPAPTMETRIALFQKKEIRKTLHADE